MKRVMINKRSGAEIMYSYLYKGLGLRDEDLTKYDTLLVGFVKKMVMPVGQIRLSVVIEGKEVMVNSIVVYAFSPYMVILARMWIHAMRAMLSILHVKVKFST